MWIPKRRASCALSQFTVKRFMRFQKPSEQTQPISRNFNIVQPHTVTDRLNVPSHIKVPEYVYGSLPSTPSTPEIKDSVAIVKMVKSAEVARKTLQFIGSHIAPNVTTDLLDRLAHDYVISQGAYPSPLGYRGFPKSICTSVNNVVCHGIPDSRPLENGDIISVDVSIYLNGYHGDCASTFLVGDKVDEQGRQLVDVARRCTDTAVSICGPGRPFSDIAKAINSVLSESSCVLVPTFCGHGIGTYFHGPPEILHFPNKKKGEMRPGLTFTIEPAVSERCRDIKVLADGWTAVSVDGSRAAQFEHTLLITEDGVRLLTDES